MNWEETVMRDEEFDDASDWYEGTNDCLKCRNLIAKAQAEKSYKAGYLECAKELADGEVRRNSMLYDAGKAVGRRELIEWFKQAVDETSYANEPDQWVKITLHGGLWQALLKELENHP